MVSDPTIQALATLARDYGLPLAILVVFGWALISGKLVVGATVDRERQEHEKELGRRDAECAYRDQLRKEEKDAREALEQRLTLALQAMAEQTELLHDIEREVVRGQARPAAGS